jgi:hypothetical protein
MARLRYGGVYMAGQLAGLLGWVFGKVLFVEPYGHHESYDSSKI